VLEKEELINESEQIVIKLNVLLNERYYLKSMLRAERDVVEATHNWLVGANILADRLIAARKQIPESMWQNYEMFGLKGLQEQAVFDRAKNALQYYLRDNKPSKFLRGHDREDGKKARKTRYKNKPSGKSDRPEAES
jgi:hypothetical protein